MLSHPGNTEAICGIIADAQPGAILDVGTGYGKWALLAREAIYSARAEAGELEPSLDVVVDGIEAAAYFRERVPWLGAVYDSFIGGDVFDLAPSSFESYDLVLLIDVVEHWPLDKGADLIGRILSTGAVVLVSTPAEVVFYEPEFYGADCAKHETQWEPHHFERWRIVDDRSTPLSHVLALA